jgi:predicted aldo/keto reductase-like oxidoreductase
LTAPVSSCVRCMECVERCPFDLPIPDLMEQAVELLEKRS